MKRLVALLLLLSLCAGLLPFALAEETIETESLAYGDDGEAVTLIQQMLIDLGYLDTKATGKYREATQKAVRQFQSEYGLEVTGEVDGETEVMLLNAEYRTLENGDDGDDVKRAEIGRAHV